MFRILTILFLLTTAVSAEEKIWAALVYASNPAKGQKPTAAPAELAEYTAKLSKTFNYEQFEILGSATKAMGGGQEKWLVPSPTFLVGAQATKQQGEYKLKLDIFQGQRRIVQTDAVLGIQSPLFVSGPRHGQGQLIIVFEIRP
jgi:hypothetical protein